MLCKCIQTHCLRLGLIVLCTSLIKIRNPFRCRTFNTLPHDGIRNFPDVLYMYTCTCSITLTLFYVHIRIYQQYQSFCTHIGYYCMPQKYQQTVHTLSHYITDTFSHYNNIIMYLLNIHCIVHCQHLALTYMYIYTYMNTSNRQIAYLCTHTCKYVYIQQKTKKRFHFCSVEWLKF